MSEVRSTLPSDLKPLAELLDNPAAQVLVVVGSGVSRGATRDPRAGWEGLLVDGTRELERLGLKDPELASAELTLIKRSFAPERFNLQEILGRAESVVGTFNEAGEGALRDWLQRSIGSLEVLPGCDAALAAIADLGRAGALLMTTNYDDLLCRAAGLEPVTWRQPEKLLEVLTRRTRAVIHIHGHWSDPASIVLGAQSYKDIVATETAQHLLKTLWTLWNWVYVGCGSGGLSDPNFDALLAWGANKFGRSTLSDFFINDSATVASLEGSVTRSPTLITHGYLTHERLPELLSQLVPEARCTPFERIGPDNPWVRGRSEDPLRAPFPSWQEYLDGAVPGLAADDEVARRLEERGWALVHDVASVGKTTLAFRLAARADRRNQPSYVLMLRRGDEGERAHAALARLARPGALLILDDAHHHPELAHALFRQWSDQPLGSSLLILSTHVERMIALRGESSLERLSIEAANPAIEIEPTPDYLHRIERYVMQRVSKTTAPRAEPPAEVIGEWHQTYAHELGAFVTAISHQERQLRSGDFALPASASKHWMQARHLAELSRAGLDNALCLAVFGEQALELEVPEHCLPQPDAVSQLLERGLAKRTGVGRRAFYSLREPSWGRLIIAAQDPRPDALRVIVDAAVKDLGLAAAMGLRATRLGPDSAYAHYWHELTARVADVAKAVSHAATEDLRSLLELGMDCGQTVLVEGIWGAISLEGVLERLDRTPLHHYAVFLETAVAQGRQQLVEQVWRGLAARLEQVVERIVHERLHLGAKFLRTARAQEQAQILEALWMALEPRVEQLVDQGLSAPLNQLSPFIEVAHDQGRTGLVLDLCRELEGKAVSIAQSALASTPNNLASFLDSINRIAGRTLVEKTCAALLEQGERLLPFALAYSLNDLGALLAALNRLGQRGLAHELGHRLGEQPELLAQKVLESPLSDVNALLKPRSEQKDVGFAAALAEALAARAGELADRVLLAPFVSIMPLVRWVRDQPKLVDRFWAEMATRSHSLAADAALREQPFHLMSLLRLLPKDLVASVLSEAKGDQWTNPARPVPMQGSCGLAFLCKATGREDLSEALVAYLLQRRRPEDLGKPTDALLELSRLLSVASAEKEREVAAIVDEVCTSAWLEDAYRHASGGALSTSLFRIALSQPPSITSRFHHPDVIQRSRVAFTHETNLALALQLLGAAVLAGWAMDWARDSSLALGRIEQVLQQLRREPDQMDDIELKLWLGLRAAAAISNRRISVPGHEIASALERWRKSASTRGETRGPNERFMSSMRAVDRSMIAWLERSAQVDGGRAVIPDRVPLWTLVGLR